MRRVVRALLTHQQGQHSDDATMLLLEWHSGNQQPCSPPTRPDPNRPSTKPSPPVSSGHPAQSTAAAAAAAADRDEVRSSPTGRAHRCLKEAIERRRRTREPDQPPGGPGPGMPRQLSCQARPQVAARTCPCPAGGGWLSRPPPRGGHLRRPTHTRRPRRSASRASYQPPKYGLPSQHESRDQPRRRHQIRLVEACAPHRATASYRLAPTSADLGLGGTCSVVLVSVAQRTCGFVSGQSQQGVGPRCRDGNAER